MVHNAKHPDAPPEATGHTQREVSRTVEEEQIDSSTTLRRTTIEEIEVRQNPSDKTHKNTQQQQD